MVELGLCLWILFVFKCCFSLQSLSNSNRIHLGAAHASPQPRGCLLSKGQEEKDPWLV